MSIYEALIVVNIIDNVINCLLYVIFCIFWFKYLEVESLEANG